MKKNKFFTLFVTLTFTIFIIFHCGGSNDETNVPVNTATGTETGTGTGTGSVLDIVLMSPLSDTSFGPCEDVLLSGTYSEGEAIAELLQYKVGINGTWQNITDASNNEWSKTIHQSELVNGEATVLYVKIEDSLSNEASDNVAVSVDSYLCFPEVRITSTSNEITDSLYTLSGVFTTYATQPTIEYKVDGGSWNTITDVTGNEFTEPDISGLLYNVHTINVRITDCEDMSGEDIFVLSNPINWIDIPGGTWEMGDRWGGGNANELPVHTVQISDFKMTETEITIARYCKYLNAVEQSDNGRWFSDMGNGTHCGIRRSGTDGSYTYSLTPGWWANHPIVYVTWTNSCDFCQYISGTLPSEAQWEYAAGGPSHYKWSLSDMFSCTSYCCNLFPCYQPISCGVTSHGINGYGLWDMSGNVWEWSMDWYSDDSSHVASGTSFYWDCYDMGTVTDPVNLYSSSPSRVLRGGSWDINDGNGLRVPIRGDDDPSNRNYDFGFRCVR